MTTCQPQKIADPVRQWVSSMSDSLLCNRWGILILFAMSTLWHGLLLTNDGTYWDSWYVLNWLENQNWASLNEFFGAVGMPIYGWLYIPFAFFPLIVQAFMVATFIGLTIQAILIWRLSERLGGLNSKESISLALLCQAVPVFTAGQDFIMFFFVFTYALFLASAYLATRVLVSDGLMHILMRVATLSLFLVSFYNGALLTFYGGFYILLFAKWRRDNGGAFWLSAYRFGLGYFDFLVLPAVGWLIRRWATPQFGWYENYNSPGENLDLIIPSLQLFFVNVVPFHVSQIGRWISDEATLFTILVAAVCIAVYLSPKTWTVQKGTQSTFAFAAFGALLLFLGIFPFAAAGKMFSPIPIGEPSRYTVLAGLPFALILYACLRLVLLSARRSSSRWLGPVCGGCSVILGVQIPPVYLQERVEWITSQSILQKAAELEMVKTSSVVVLQNCGLSAQTVYGIYAFETIFGDFTRLVINTAPQNQLFFTPSEIAMCLFQTTSLSNMLHQIDPSGQQTLLVVQRKSDSETDWQVVFKYLKIRCFGQPAEMHAFLDGFTMLETRLLKPATPMVLQSGKVIESSGVADKHFSTFSGIEMIPLNKRLWAGRYEVTQAQYQEVMGLNPSLFVDTGRPVERVSWNEAVIFCHKLTELERSRGSLPEGCYFRLPTVEEHQDMAVGCLMEQAVLAGGATHWQTSPVGSKGQGPGGFCDVVGNVWEWVGRGGPGEYQEAMESASESWQTKARRMKVACGGGFANYPTELRSYPIIDQKLDFFTKVYLERLFGPTRRDYPDQSFWDRGFRVVMASQSN